jgi:hypothetical protein
VAELKSTAQPAVDQAGRPPGADGLPVSFEPGFAGGVTGQVLAFGVGEQRTQMQLSGFVFDIQMHHDGGVLPVGSAGHIGVPSGLHQAHESVGGVRQRRPLI